MAQAPPDIRRIFLETLTDLPIVGKACRRAGITRRQAFKWRAEDPDFRREWDAAVDIGVTALEDEAILRAKNGSDRLLMFVLRAARPEKYRENIKIEETLGNPPPLTIRLVRGDKKE